MIWVMTFPLLASKFHRPAPGARHVMRPRLVQRLDQALRERAPLIVVSGAAGYGKTMLVSAWLQGLAPENELRQAWLTLERSEDELPGFLTYLVSALQQADPQVGRGVLKLLHTHKPPPALSLAALLINDISTSPERILLVLDDLHLLSGEPIMQWLSFLVEHQPANLTLVLVTRADPPLPLARLRARGQLVEIRQAELRFSADETRQFLQQVMEVELQPGQVGVLERRTEGWIAGLQLAALALRGQADPASFLASFSGEHEFIAGYLGEEVLASLPQARRDFLLQTAILERLCAPLCAAVTGQPGAQETLEQLAEANLFLIPLDNQRRWFRYHSLFADLLRKRLMETAGAEVSQLHRRASAWCAAHEELSMAIEHALGGQDYGRAVELIEPLAEQTLMLGEAATLQHWLGQVPRPILAGQPGLLALAGFARLMSGGTPAQVTELVQALEAGSQPAAYQGEATTLQALLAILQGQAASAVQLSQQALDQLPDGAAFFRALAADCLGMGYTLAGDFEAALRAFDQVVALALPTDNVLMALMARTNQAGLRYMLGSLRQAVADCQQVLELAEQRFGRLTPLVGKTLFNLGEMLREQGDLAGAERYLLEAARQMTFFSEVGLPLTYLALARLRLHQGRWDETQDFLERARQAARLTRATQMDDRLVELTQVRCWLEHGDLEPVVSWARGRAYLEPAPAELVAGHGPHGLADAFFLAECLNLARLALAQHRSGWAGEMLALLRAFTEQTRIRRRLLEILVLESLAYEQQGQTEQALQALGEALAMGEAEGYQRVFVDQGEPMARLLYQALRRGLAPGYTGWLLQVMSEANLPAEPLPQAPGPGLVEALSARELEVLHLVAEGLSNAEIARRLYLSLSTVKGHTVSIYRKLGVEKRTQAVARGRSLGLLKAG